MAAGMDVLAGLGKELESAASGWLCKGCKAVLLRTLP